MTAAARRLDAPIGFSAAFVLTREIRPLQRLSDPALAHATTIGFYRSLSDVARSFLKSST
jgi:hypothetical protein